MTIVQGFFLQTVEGMRRMDGQAEISHSIDVNDFRQISFKANGTLVRGQTKVTSSFQLRIKPYTKIDKV